ncbi:vesicle-associated protein 4-2-like [Herrania umbratica]|uniref:Vesicle-associated protein 4-2-like n=1 Tax=Herrania umbratica TaxID=108875 RepID=A0A6J0ZSJ5_9ROSI|nr:vesicle-associated protein 4-2-like [Herrania umbratica]
MGVDEEKSEGEGKVWSLCRMPFWQTSSSNGNGSSSSSSSSSSMGNNNGYQQSQTSQLGERSTATSSNAVSSMAKSLLPTRRRLRLDPPNKLYFPYEPGKQVRSAIGIKNTSKSHVAFKFQTTAPKSCYMRPPGGILAPGESLIATVFKFVEPPENNEKPIEQKSRVKFKIMTLKVKGETDYVPELFDEQKDQVAVEQILRVVFLDPERSCPALEKLKRQLAEAEAEAALEARKRPPEETGPRMVGEGLVIDEWKERRERYLARQQVECADSA